MADCDDLSATFQIIAVLGPVAAKAESLLSQRVKLGSQAIIRVLVGFSQVFEKLRKGRKLKRYLLRT